MKISYLVNMDVPELPSHPYVYFRPEELPSTEKDAAIYTERLIRSLRSYIENFYHNLILFEHSRVLLRETQAELKKTSTSHSTANPEVSFERGILASKKVSLFYAWQLSAAKSAALNIYDLSKCVRSIIYHVTNKCPVLHSSLPVGFVKSVDEAKKEVFENIDKVRHAIAHNADNKASVKDFMKHAVDPAVESIIENFIHTSPGGSIFLEPSILGQHLTVSIARDEKGRNPAGIFRCEISAHTLEKLLQIKKIITTGFYEASEKIHFKTIMQYSRK